MSRVNDFDPGGFSLGEGEISSPDAIVKLDLLSLESILFIFATQVPSQSPFQAHARRAIQKKGQVGFDSSGCKLVELFHPPQRNPAAMTLISNRGITETVTQDNDLFS